MTVLPDAFVGAVLAWGGPSLRDLPWRRSRDPWQILVSEVMSQQTQVHRVIPKWEAFIDRFPTPQSCASASLGEILGLWQGLGYPRRARDLHRSASILAEWGEVPNDLDRLLTLPGVGDYTARAVMSFAFDADVAVIDTNVARVLARATGERLTARRARELADSLIPIDQSWLWNQAMMDLGGTICRSRAPICDQCPVTAWCSWRGSTEGVDPAAGSAGVSGRQSAFEGSRRQARGRLLKALGDGPVLAADVGSVMGRPAEEAAGILAGLIDDGLCRVDGESVVLP